MWHDPLNFFYLLLGATLALLAIVAYLLLVRVLPQPFGGDHDVPMDLGRLLIAKPPTLVFPRADEIKAAVAAVPESSERKPTVILRPDTAQESASEQPVVPAQESNIPEWLFKLQLTVDDWKLLSNPTLFRAYGLTWLNLAHSTERLDLQLAQAMARPEKTRELIDAINAYNNLCRAIDTLHAETRAIRVLQQRK
jgi:hypothetical protein